MSSKFEENTILSTTSSSITRGCPFRESSGSTSAESTARPLAVKGAFVALSKFVVANDKSAEVRAAFRDRPHLVDDQPGFLRLEVFSPLDRPEEIWLITYWSDAESFTIWRHSHLYNQSHKGIPKELKLVPGETEVRHFEQICT